MYLKQCCFHTTILTLSTTSLRLRTGKSYMKKHKSRNPRWEAQVNNCVIALALYSLNEWKGITCDEDTNGHNISFIKLKCLYGASIAADL